MHSLWRAAQGGNLDAVCQVLLAGVDVNARTSSGETALHIASAGNYVPVVRRLLAHPSIDVNVMSSEGSTPLHLACHRGHAAVIVLLLRDPRTSVNVGWTSSCVTPLFLAVKQGCEAAVAVLLREPTVDPNSATLEMRATPLHMATYLGNPAIVARLLQRESTNVKARTKDGMLAVDIALMTDQRAIVWLLVEADTRLSRAAERGTIARVLWHYLYLRANWHYNGRTPSESAYVQRESDASEYC